LTIYSQSARLAKNRAKARALGAAENAPPLFKSQKANKKLDDHS